MDSNTIVKALQLAKDEQGWEHGFIVEGDDITDKNYSTNVKWIHGKDNAGVGIFVNEKQITWAKLQPFITKAEDYYKSIAHQPLRQRAYPSIADQLDDIYHNGIDGWKATIKAVKDKYPKE
tara:strand:- start:78 stop:440 length:363 start_codon:yes stop_codon:yes gene_type:complete